MVCRIFPALSIIYIIRWCLVAEMTEKPSSGEQNTVPSMGFTFLAREAEEFTM